jgi:hypothetical protein
MGGMDAAETKKRWFRFSPGGFVGVLLAMECLIWLSNRLEWPHWQKGYGVLSTLATLGVALIAMLLWFLCALVFRRRFQFSICSLLVLGVAVALPFSWFATARGDARRQCEDRKAIAELGGEATYDYQFDEKANQFWSCFGPISPPDPVPELLSSRFGNDFFHEVVYFRYRGSATGADSDREVVLRHLRRMRDLRVIEMPGGLTDSQLLQLIDLKKLRKLNLRNSYVAYAGLAVLDRAAGIEELNLEHTKVTDAGMEHLVKLLNLRKLNVAQTAVTDAGLRELAHCPELVDLDLYKTHIGDEGLRTLAVRTDIKALELGYTNTTDAGVAYLKSFPNMETLVLAYTKVTDKGVAQLTYLTHLRRLRLMGIKVSKDVAEKLRRALPDCRIDL